MVSSKIDIKKVIKNKIEGRPQVVFGSEMKIVKPNKPKNFRSKFFISILMIICSIFAITTYYFYRSYSNIAKSPEKIAEEEARKIVDKLSMHILLPTDEFPAVATVTDINKLKNQQFFVNAKNGDKVVIYKNAGKAILYDPIADKIIDIAYLGALNSSGTIIEKKENAIVPTSTISTTTTTSTKTVSKKK